MRVFYCKVKCECGGFMYKSSLSEDNAPVLFSLCHPDKKDKILVSSIVFVGYCNGCGKEFDYAIDVSSLLQFREV